MWVGDGTALPARSGRSRRSQGLGDLPELRASMDGDGGGRWELGGAAGPRKGAGPGVAIAGGWEGRPFQWMKPPKKAGCCTASLGHSNTGTAGSSLCPEEVGHRKKF